MLIVFSGRVPGPQLSLAAAVAGSASGHARDERLGLLLRVLNDVLSRHPQARRRSVGVAPPLHVSVSPRARLVADDSPSGGGGLVTLQGVYEAHCRRSGLDPDAPLARCRDESAAINRALADAASAATAAAAAASAAATAAAAAAAASSTPAAAATAAAAASAAAAATQCGVSQSPQMKLATDTAKANRVRM